MPVGAIPFPFGDCRICNDKATGVHYGVATCEGCKGFFRRSIPKGEKYKCFFGGQCVISPQNRNRCKACRFKKCLDTGMAIDAVKMGRIPKIEKEKALEAARTSPPAEPMDTTPIENHDTNMNFQNNFASGSRMMIPPLNIKQEAETSFASCDRQQDNFDPNFSHNSYSFNPLPLSNVWSGMDITNDHIKTDPQYDNTTPSAFENTNYPLIPRNTCTPGSDDSSSGSRNHFSPDVIKVLLDQAVEKRGGQHIKNTILQRLASENIYGDNGIPVFQSLSSSVGSSSSASTSDRQWQDNFERMDSPPATVLDMRMENSFSFQNNDLQTGTQTTKTSTNGIQQPMCQATPCTNNISAFDDHESSLQKIINISDGSSSDMMYSLSQKHQSDLKTESDLILSNNTHKTFNQQYDIQVPGIDGKLESIFDCDYYKIIAKYRHYNLEDVYELIKRSHKKKGEMGDWITKTVNQIEKALETYNQHLRENRTFVKEFLRNGGKVPLEPKTPETVKEMWDLVINGIPIINKRIIGFCNSVPGFISLCSEDQQPMVKHAYYSIWMLTTSEFFINGESYLRFPNGRFYTKFWMKNFLTEKRVAHIFAFAEKFNQLQLTDTEAGILSAIQLMTYDCDELMLKNAQSVQILHVHYLDILVQLICESHPNAMCETLLEILNLFPHLCYINKMQRDMAAEFLLNKPPRPDQAAEDSVKS